MNYFKIEFLNDECIVKLMLEEGEKVIICNGPLIIPKDLTARDFADFINPIFYSICSKIEINTSLGGE